MDYLSKSPNHCSKGLLNFVLKCTKTPGKKSIGYMFKKKCSSLGQRYKHLLLVLTEKGGIKSSHSQFFDNELLSSSKPLKIGPKDYYFKPNMRTYAITIPCVLRLV